MSGAKNSALKSGLVAALGEEDLARWRLPLGRQLSVPLWGLSLYTRLGRVIVDTRESHKRETPEKESLETLETLERHFRMPSNTVFNCVLL